MSDFEALRERFSPLAEVYIGRADDGSEWLYIGEINGTSMYRRSEDKRFHLERIPVQPREPCDLAEWIQSGPDELNRAMDADLPDALGDTVGISESYPPIEEIEEGER